MRVEWNITSNFDQMCEAVIRNVARGTKAATTQACEEILKESLKQVPVDTGTLASTAHYEVSRRGDVKGYAYEATIGYSGDAINPYTGAAASSYATIVHEDLHAVHTNGRKAKFLEDPIRAYAERFSRITKEHWSNSITGGTR